jgi:hypothetical protein
LPLFSPQQLPVKLKIWAEFGNEVDKLRSDPPGKLNLPEDLVYFDSEKLGLPAGRSEEKEEVKEEEGLFGRSVVEGKDVGTEKEAEVKLEPKGETI